MTGRDRPSAVGVIGAGGHAKVVISTLRAIGVAIQAAYDDDPGRWGHAILGVPILGPIASHVTMAAKETPFVIAIGANAHREAIATRFPATAWFTAVHPRAWVDESVQLGSGTLVCAGAIIQPDAQVGDHVIVNTMASIDHDCSAESYVHVAPGAHLGGAVSLSRGALVGLGSSILPGVAIGSWTCVGAGAVVLRDLPANVCAAGVPAEVLRSVREEPETERDSSVGSKR